MLSLRGVRKSFGDKKAVDGVDLEVPSGEVFGLLGPNGAGKSTTLRMVSGLVFPDAGSVTVDSVDMAEDPETVRSKVAYVPDEPTVYPRLSGREFLRFAGRLRGIAPEELEMRIGFHEKLFDMGGWLDKRAESYSHGMIQRVVLSSAFVARASLYAIDEPLVGLDPASAETFHRMARGAAAGGAAVVISTHTLPVAHRFCHRLGIIHRGRLVRTLRPEEVDREDLQRLFFEITGTAPADVSIYFD
jgi:ABC-2 type transport system ATP-binding protein